MDAYEPDRSIVGKVRRRLARLVHRRPVWMKLERPMVSFTFDDAPVTAAMHGGALLQERGLRGTYFISAGLAGQKGPMGVFADLGEVRRLHAAGHEIACHTYSHLDCGQAGGDAVLAEAERNREALEGQGLPSPTTFAYPYGDVSFGAKQALARRFSLLRGLHHGLVEQGTDLNQTPSVGLEGPDAERLGNTWLAQAKARKGWLILYTHDVAERPSPWGVRRDVFANLVDQALNLGLDVVTVAEGARRIGALAA